MTTIKDYECLECHKRLTLKQAERALNGDSGCPKCGGSDIDLYVPSPAPSRINSYTADLRQAELYATD